MPMPRVVWAIARRSLVLIPRLPSTFIPSIVMPIFLTVAFAGPFANLVNLPGFPADHILDWILPMTALQGAAFAGVTTGMGVVRDLENGFYDRLFASPVSRSSLIIGPLVASMLRAIIPLALLIPIGMAAGVTFPAGAAALGPLVVAGLGVALCGGAWSLGWAYRFKSHHIVPVIQMGIFLSMFLSTAQMPIEYLSGWLHAVARFNPMTNVLALAREGFLGEIAWSQTWPGLVALVGMFSLLLVFAARGMTRV